MANSAISKLLRRINPHPLPFSRVRARGDLVLTPCPSPILLGTSTRESGDFPDSSNLGCEEAQSSHPTLGVPSQPIILLCFLT